MNIFEAEYNGMIGLSPNFSSPVRFLARTSNRDNGVDVLILPLTASLVHTLDELCPNRRVSHSSHTQTNEERRRFIDFIWTRRAH